MFLSGLSGWRMFLLRFLVSLFFVGLVYWAADYWTIGIWNSRESLVVRVLEAGPEAPREKVPDDRSVDGSGDETFPALERPLRVLVLTGDQKRHTFDIVVTRLAGSGVDPTPNRRYLLVEDIFEDDSKIGRAHV